MTYLLDSDTLIFLVRGTRILNPKTLSQRRSTEAAARIRSRCVESQRSGHHLGLSVLTVAELEFGARGSTDYDSEIAAVHLILRPFTVFDFSAPDCSQHYGEIRHALESSGTPLGAMDLLIAAHARALNATLITHNLADFAKVPNLPVEDWAVHESSP